MPTDVQDAFVTRVRSVQDMGYEVADGERFVVGLDVGVLVGLPGSKIKAALVVATLKSANGPDPDKIRAAVTYAGHKITQLIGSS